MAKKKAAKKKAPLTEEEKAENGRKFVKEFENAYKKALNADAENHAPASGDVEVIEK